MTREVPSEVLDAVKLPRAEGEAELKKVSAEWCGYQGTQHPPSDAHTAIQPREALSQLRGGSFRTDLTYDEPIIRPYNLRDGHASRNSDIGFRIAGVIPVNQLPTDLVNRLRQIRSMSRSLFPEMP